MNSQITIHSAKNFTVLKGRDTPGQHKIGMGAHTSQYLLLGQKVAFEHITKTTASGQQVCTVHSAPV